MFSRSPRDIEEDIGIEDLDNDFQEPNASRFTQEMRDRSPTRNAEGSMQQDGRPCYHAVGAFGKTDLMQRMMPHLPVGHAWFKCAWDVIYTVKGYKRCLGTGFVLLPQRHLLKSDPNVLVQLDTKTAGCW